jgi:hypothetical protein
MQRDPQDQRQLLLPGIFQMYPHPIDYLLKKTAFAVSMNLTSRPNPFYKQEN